VVGVEHVVVVEEQDPVAGHRRDAGVARRTGTARRLVLDDAGFGEFGRQHGERIVGRRLVDDHDLLVRPRLLARAAQRLAQPIPAIAGRHDDGNLVAQDVTSPGPASC
jgi:hypothetical protein